MKAYIMVMTNLSVLNQFFNERIRLVDGQTKPLLQKLKSVCERRASGQISEEKALFELDKILGKNSSPILPSTFSNSKPVNLFAGVRTNIKQKPVMSGIMDFNLENKREQFPVLGLRPLNSDSKKKRFVIAPMSRSWFDIKDFKRAEPVISNFKNVKQNNSSVLGGLNIQSQNKSVVSNFKSDVFSHRMNESNKAMKAMLNNARQNIKVQPALGGMVSPLNPRQGKRVYPKRQQSVFEMMGGKK